MKPEKIGLSGWVFYLTQARKLDKQQGIIAEKRRMRMMETWGQVFPCPMCQRHYASLVDRYKHTKIPKLAQQQKSYDWFLFVRHEINRNAPAVRLQRIRYHSYRYLSAICHSYEPKINPAYCKRVKRFFAEWKPAIFCHLSRSVWNSHEALWNVLDQVFPREAQQYRQVFQNEFESLSRD